MILSLSNAQMKVFVFEVSTSDPEFHFLLRIYDTNHLFTEQSQLINLQTMIKFPANVLKACGIVYYNVNKLFVSALGVEIGSSGEKWKLSVIHLKSYIS